MVTAFAGIITHIIGDMVTGTVKLLYPLDKSIGFKIHPIHFNSIDRITRALLIVCIFLIIVNITPSI